MVLPLSRLGSFSATPDLIAPGGASDTPSEPARQSDPLTDPTHWPSVASHYVIIAAKSTVTLGVTLAAEALMPGPDQRGDALVAAAERQRDRYAAIYDHYAQPGLAVTIETSLQTGPAPHPQGVEGLLTLAGGGHLAGASAALFTAVAPASAALGAIVAEYGISLEALAAANAAVPLSAIFGETVGLTVPAYVAATKGDSAASIAGAPRAGSPAPTAAEILNAPENAALPLRLGAVLACPPRPVILPEDALTLATVATAAATHPGWLAADSSTNAILSAGFTFTIGNATVVVGARPMPQSSYIIETFADAVRGFADLGVAITAYELGQVNADAPGLLIAGATAHSAHYVVTGTATLADNPGGAASADLIAANLATPDLFEPGTLLWLGAFGTGIAPAIVPATGETLADFARRHLCTTAEILAANAALEVIPDTGLAIPGAVALADWNAVAVPYTLRADDTLSGVAAGFDLSDAPDKTTDLAARNADLPGTVAQDISFTVSVGGTQVPVHTAGLFSFAAVLSAVRQTAPDAVMADVAAAFDMPGRLAPGGLLVAPPVLFAAATAPADIPALYGVPAAAFAAANAGMTGLLIAGTMLAAPEPGAPAVTVLARDSLNALVGRFNALSRDGGGEPVTIAHLIAANGDVPLFAAGARALLPPADIILSRPIAASGPYPGPAFPLAVELVVTRATPTACGTVPPLLHDALTLDAFGQALVTALPDLRFAVATADDQASELWAVDFGAAGIKSVALSPGASFAAKPIPRMIGRAPLYHERITRGVPIAPLVDGRLDPGQAVGLAFHAVDVEIWAVRFLGAFDRLLSPAMAAAIDAVPELKPQAEALTRAAAVLQAAIPADLAAIFTVPDAGQTDPRAVTDPRLAAGLAAAQRTMAQSADLSPASAWATRAIVQFDAAVDSGWTQNPHPDETAALLGDAAFTPSPAGEHDPMAAWRLAAGPLPLAEKASFLTLLLSADDPGERSHLAFIPDYGVSGLELQRSAGEADRLAMMPVLAGSTLPSALSAKVAAIDVPLPLTTAPETPNLVSQTALADPASAATLAGAARWLFGIVYAHSHAAQDEVLVTAEFNLDSAAPRRTVGATASGDLFTALAQYVQVADELDTLLAGLVAPGPAQDIGKTQAAVATFAGLATDIASLWGVRNAGGGAGPGGDDWRARSSCPLSARISYTADAPRDLAAYTLTRLPGATGGAVDWPDVAVEAADGQWSPLPGAAPDGQRRSYFPPDGVSVPVAASPNIALTWPVPNVSAQNARATLAAVRNRDLLGPDGPATADAFVFHTGVAAAAGIVAPVIVRTDPLLLQGETVAAALQTAFDTLLPPAGRPANLSTRISLSYAYALVPGPDPLMSEMPVALVNEMVLDGNTAGTIAATLNDWLASADPDRTQAEWRLSLRFSVPEPGSALLEIDQLIYRL
ncbi:hypothetical protein U1769_20660 [Sphingomonas sp. ZT3P38]|uniref:hypothetical protein n=1 Tax=Parasphingomonas zepuensis TaxID=3096161 RepID=UPI002FC634F3